MSIQTAQTPGNSSLSLLIEWANGQDHWIRKLVEDVVASKKRLSDECITDLREQFLREKKLAQGESPSVKSLSRPQVFSDTAADMRLVSLEHMENVNALAPSQKIEFHPRLTVCFGENASGKSGYVRILKRAAAVRTAQEIVPNIHAEGSGKLPRAKIKIKLGDDERAIQWQGEHRVEPLTRVTVFDNHSAVVHISEDLNYTYTPDDLALFPLVTDAIDRVQSELAVVRREHSPSGNPVVDRFVEGTPLHAKIKGLGPSTDLQELQRLAQLSDREEADLQTLPEIIAGLNSASVQAQITLTEQEQAVLAEVILIGDAVIEFDSDAYMSSSSHLRAARADHERASQQELSGENIPGILGDTWQGFVEAAENYIRDVDLDPYPVSHAPCVYCRQPLGHAAVELIQKYRDYSNAALRKAVDQSRERIRLLSEKLVALPLDETERDLGRLLEAQEETPVRRSSHAAAMDVIKYARSLRDAVSSELARLPEHKGVLAAVANVRAASESIRATSVDLRKEGIEHKRALSDNQERLSDIKARLVLRESMPKIRKRVLSTQWSEQLALYLQKFPDIKRSLTNTAKRASNEVMNKPFEKLFRAECRALRAPKVKLNFPGREGQSRRQKLVTREHDLQEILSEGEQKVIALADFLAEATLNPDCSPIVLDDPVTSLDHRRLQYVVDRLAEISGNRQIVVFTHDIWFAAGLLGRFEQEPNECAFYDVAVEDERIGLVTPGSHPRTDTFNYRRTRMEKVIEQAANETGEEQEHLIERGYEILRGTCEVVVEKDLLRGVTERLRPNVRMTVLNQIRADRLPDAVQQVTHVFERCCRIISSHSQPLTVLGVRPTLSDLKADWKTLKVVRKEYLQP